MQNGNTKILCRAQGGEPVVRTVSSYLDGAVEVIDAASGRSCLFPEADTFEFDANLASKLTVAYRNGHVDRLRDLWSDATRLTGDPIH